MICPPLSKPLDPPLFTAHRFQFVFLDFPPGLVPYKPTSCTSVLYHIVPLHGWINLPKSLTSLWRYFAEVRWSQYNLSPYYAFLRLRADCRVVIYGPRILYIGRFFFEPKQKSNRLRRYNESNSSVMRNTQPVKYCMQTSVCDIIIYLFIITFRLRSAESIAWENPLE